MGSERAAIAGLQLDDDGVQGLGNRKRHKRDPILDHSGSHDVNDLGAPLAGKTGRLANNQAAVDGSGETIELDPERCVDVAQQLGVESDRDVELWRAEAAGARENNNSNAHCKLLRE